ncbi:MAG: nuclease-related domain-containing protein [Cyanobacteriota bacterium]|nr:nuclease-related domain-containing protein [Cyanobacteriota bacterium]
MSIKTKQPGEYIRKLARKRKLSAMIRYFLAAGVSIATLWLFITFASSSAAIFILLTGISGSYYLYRSGKYFEKRALDARRGAKAETDVADLLDVSELQKWQIEYNLRIRRWGDADIVLFSPKGKWYVVDVKSHGGTKISENGRLRRRYGKNIYDFREGDLIHKVKGQAKEVRKLKGASWATAILCFTRGGVNIPDSELNGIYVVDAKKLVDILLKLDK